MMFILVILGTMNHITIRIIYLVYKLCAYFMRYTPLNLKIAHESSFDG